MRIEGYISMGFKKPPHDMIRAVKYRKRGSGSNSMGKKQRSSNKWRIREGIRKIRRMMAEKHRWMVSA